MRPSSLAAWHAVSACACTICGDVAVWSIIRIPIEQVRLKRICSQTNATSLSAWIILCATNTASRSVQSRSNTENSSPPIRAKVALKGNTSSSMLAQN
ncbi:Uncharacterised protein [Vibrio cholerae]|nr:Uncharacterised protein [Vibrio cholerae]